ncbi:leucine-rich repeat-containing protein 70 [Gastrophryne carolinensis]
MSSRQREMYGSENCLTPLQVSLFGYVFLLLLQKLAICCPTICQICLEKQVNCRSSGLTTIPKNLPKTATLIYLSGNNLTKISHNEFTEFTELAVLYLDNSNIFDIHPKAFSSLRKLYYLHLNDNNIQHLDVGIFDRLLNLHYLHLQQNQIGVLPQGLFGYLKSVRYLTLQKNKIQNLGSDVFSGMKSLHTLNLANNNISWISDTAWRHLENLENLYLDSNRLKQVPSNSLGFLKGLKRLSLSNNQIGSIYSFAFRGLSSLQYLFLENADIQAISKGSFSGLSSLKQLILSRNRIHNLDSKSFFHLSHLVYLQLDKNGIVSISDDTFEEMGRSLKVLNLAFNNLTSLQPKVLQPLISLKYFQASYNPWNCGCGLLGLRTFLLSSAYKFSINCETPSRLRNRPLGNLKITEFEDCLFTSTVVSPVHTPQLYSTTTKAMHSHIKGTTNQPFFNSQGTGSIVSAESDTMKTNINDTAPTPTPITDEQLIMDILSAESESIKSSSNNTTRNPTHIIDEKLSMDILLYIQPVNFTNVEENDLQPDIVTVSLKPIVICQQENESLSQSFFILLSFFIFACMALVALTLIVIQMKKKNRTPEIQGDSVLEYYSCYQSGRYEMTDPLRIAPPNPLPSPQIDVIRPIKQSPPEAQTEVILFEHSAL